MICTYPGSQEVGRGAKFGNGSKIEGTRGPTESRASEDDGKLRRTGMDEAVGRGGLLAADRSAS